MKNILTTTKQMTEILKAPDLNIVDALTIIGSTIQSLKSVQRKQAEMDALSEAEINYTKKMGGDAHEENGRKYRVRCKPARIDGQPQTAANMTIFKFYRKEFNEVLNMQITRLGDNLGVCLSIVEPIAKICNCHCKKHS